MKKIYGIILVLGLALVLSGCDFFSGGSVGTTGNPEELTGTWNGTVTNISTTKAEKASVQWGTEYEGTWESKWVVPPSVPIIQVNGTTSYTQHQSNETTTTTTTYKKVVTPDGSYVLTQTVSRDVAARAAITATANESASAAIVAGTMTYTRVTTATVTPTASGKYKERVVIKDSLVGTGSQIGQSYNGWTIAATEQSQTTESTTEELNATSLGYATQPGSGPWIQTVKGATPALTYPVTTTTTYKLEVAADGTFTFTTTSKTSQEAKAAVTGSATAASAPAILAGTTTQTTVNKGTLSAWKEMETKYMALNATSEDRTTIGTGGLISPDYPVAELKTTKAVATTTVYDYNIVKGSAETRLFLANSIYLAKAK